MFIVIMYRHYMLSTIEFNRVQMRKIWAETALAPDGWKDSVLISINPEGRISGVESGQVPEGERFSVLLPAPSNLHSHSFQRAMAGLAENRSPDGQDDFWGWRQLMYEFLSQFTPEDIATVAAYAQMEMLEAGFASVGEFHYLHHASGGGQYENPAEMSLQIISAAGQSGIGLTLLPTLYEQGGCNGRKLIAGQDRFSCDVSLLSKILENASARIRELSPDSIVGAAAHSLRAARPESIAEAIDLLPNAPFHIHLAEQEAEVNEVESCYGDRPVSWLLSHFDVDTRWCLIHCTQMKARETLALAATKAVAGLCPITESNLGDGTFDGVRFLKAGGSLGIGSDSNVRIALGEEMRTLEYSQRLRDRSRASLAVNSWSSGRALFDCICEGGAQACGRTAGAIKVGMWADLLELERDSIVLADLEGNRLLDAWIFSGDNELVRNVWSAGRHLVRDGKHMQRLEIEKRFKNVQARLRGAL